MDAQLPGLRCLGDTRREGVTTVPATCTRLTFSTDGPAGVKVQVFWPHSQQQRGRGAHEPAFPLAPSPLVSAPSPSPLLFPGAGPWGRSTG